MFDKILMKDLIKRQKRLLKDIKHFSHEVDNCYRSIQSKKHKIDFYKGLRR